MFAGMLTIFSSAYRHYLPRSYASVSLPPCMGASALDKDSRPNPSGADSLLLPASDGVRMPARMITEARERVLGGWCQGAVARDASGRAVAASSSHACQWSLLGSLLASRNGGRLSELADAVGSLHSSIGESALEVWNDRPWRTQQEVVAAFDRAMDTTAGGEKESPSADGDLSAYWQRRPLRNRRGGSPVA